MSVKSFKGWCISCHSQSTNFSFLLAVYLTLFYVYFAADKLTILVIFRAEYHDDIQTTSYLSGALTLVQVKF